MKRFQPALLGGLFVGVLSGLPFVGGANLCCCLWVVTGGVLTAYLQQQATPDPLETGEAALGGLVAGLIGAIISVLISSIVFSIFAPMWQGQFAEQFRQGLESNPGLPPEARDRIVSLVSALTTGPGFFLVKIAIALPVYAIFGLLGGLLGLAFFKKKLPPAAAPPAPPTATM